MGRLNRSRSPEGPCQLIRDLSRDQGQEQLEVVEELEGRLNYQEAAKKNGKEDAAAALESLEVEALITRMTLESGPHSLLIESVVPARPLRSAPSHPWGQMLASSKSSRHPSSAPIPQCARGYTVASPATLAGGQAGVDQAAYRSSQPHRKAT